MRAPLRSAVTALLAIALVACGGDAAPDATAAGPETGPVAAASADLPTPARIDTATLHQRAAAALAANRLYAPAGDNAVEDYLALRGRQPGDRGVETALADLAPYVVIGAEQATMGGDFDEAERLIDLLARMDADAPAAPRLRDAVAEARVAADLEAVRRADAEEAAAPEAAPVAPAPTPSTATRAPAVARPSAPPVLGAPPEPTATAAPSPAPFPTPPQAVAPTPTTARAVLQRVPPRFPEAAARRRLEGEVELQVGIRADGSVASVEVLRADPPGVFDREAVLAVRRWRYAPAGSASEARVVLQFRRESGN